MVYPDAENMCEPFGENDLKNLTPWHSNASQKGKGNYTWVLWRHYKGCIEGEGKYSGSINF